MVNTQVDETTKNGDGGRKGSGVYTFLGLAIIVVVIVGSFFLFPWKDLFKEKVDKNLVAANAALEKKNWKEAITLFGKSLICGDDGKRHYTPPFLPVMASTMLSLPTAPLERASR